MFYPESSAKAEAIRIEWLETYLADTAVCPDGYIITARKAVPINAFGTVHKIYYEGECE